MVSLFLYRCFFEAVENSNGEKEGVYVEETILHGGVPELLELKNTLQEKNRYNAVLDSLDAAVDEQKEKIEERKIEIDKAMNVEVQRRRELVAKPFLDEIAACEVEQQKVKNEKEKRRQELIEQIINEETEMYEKRKKNIEKQMKLVSQEENIPAICTSRLFLAFFCPRTGKDAMILVIGLVLLFLVFPLGIYYGAYGGNNRQVLTTIYLVLIVVFYTLYLLINNLVKDKYLVGINRTLKLMQDQERLELQRKNKLKELEKIPDSSLDLSEFEEETIRLQAVIDELNKQKTAEQANFDSNQRLQLEIANEIKEKYRPELEAMRAELDEKISDYDKMQTEYNKFLNEKNIEQRYDILIRMEPGIFNQTVIDELIFYITHGDAENISKALVKRRKSIGQGPMSLQ